MSADATQAPGGGRARVHPVAALVAIVGLVVLLFHLSVYMPYFDDDALISMRYAKRLASGGGLTWNDVDRVEGYSNLLWVLLVAAGAGAGIEPVLGARALGLACAVTVIATLLHVLGRGRHAAAAVALAVGLCVTTGSFAVWTIAGLEQPLVGALLVVAVAALWPTAPPFTAVASAALAGLCLTRPDGPVLVIGVVTGHALVRGVSASMRREVVALAAPSVFAVVGQELFRLAYYGDWVPNTARVKVAWTATRLSQGMMSLEHAAATHVVLIVLVCVAMAFAVRVRVLRPAVALTLSAALPWIGYLLVMGDGGTYFAWRHEMPIVPLFALVAGVLLTTLPADTPRLVVAGLVAGALAANSAVQHVDPFEGLARAMNSDVLMYAEESSAVLRRVFGDRDPLMGVTAAGGLPYFTDFRAIDLHGLADAEIARHRPTDIGHGWMGHELGDARFVLSREPDLLIFGMPPGREPEAHGVEGSFLQHPAWSRYVRVFLEARAQWPAGVVMLWVRRDSPAVGIQRAADRIDVPAGLLASHRAHPAVAPVGGPVTVDATIEEPVGLDAITIDGGSWRVEVEAQAPVSLTVRAGGAIVGEGEPPLELTLPAGEVGVEVRPVRGELAGVLGVRFRRVGP